MVYTKNTSEPLNTSTFSHAFDNFIKKLELPHIRFHDLRHTNAALIFLADTPAKIAFLRLDHSTINITMDLYSHILKDMNIDAADKLNNVIYS
ncbi:tyrosine-type recombinase/integrase [Clostridium botulinum]|uniref:tyrosine-type recombinase/integrase n=1 Tax=Clostridium botulinum TaxID=1491 RepID=UPI00090819E6|nr:tyrosine-type recombinase/integrase [Clostridium botulinum]